MSYWIANWGFCVNFPDFLPIYGGESNFFV
jgi:hypothetical protein